MNKALSVEQIEQIVKDTLFEEAVGLGYVFTYRDKVERFNKLVPVLLNKVGPEYIGFAKYYLAKGLGLDDV